jgi:adenine deaminase
MDLPVVVEGNLVDVLRDSVYPARITSVNGVIVGLERIPGPCTGYVLPGLVDSHVHVESSMLVPSRFAEAAVPRGVVSAVADPHEIANVMGVKGVEFMIRDAASVPLKFRFMAPSCVPATEFETSGAELGVKDVEYLMGRSEIYGLAEVMNYPGVIRRDPDVIAKIEVARRHGKPVDGHAPGLRGEDLDRYMEAGITTDHECTTEAEAREKAEKGMCIQVREGSACRNMEALAPVAKEHVFFFSTDDMHASDCLRHGYMDRLLSKAVSLGIDPLRAVKAATLWPSQHYRLGGGYLSVNTPADMVIVEDLEGFRVREVYIDGKLVAEGGRALFEAEPLSCETGIVGYDTVPGELEIKHGGDSAKVRVIEVHDGQILSSGHLISLAVEGGVVQPDIERDVLVMAVASRYARSRPAIAFVCGFGFDEGAISSTVAHDSHNIVAVGTSYELVSKAINAVSAEGGHYATDGIREERLPLPVAGLMSTEKAETVSAAEDRLTELVRSMGGRLRAPFMTLSFQCLLVVPALKLSDRGLFDSSRFGFADLFAD